MKAQDKFYLLGLSLVFVLSGCVVRSYPLTRERVDQGLAAGNRGYLQGQAPYEEVKERKAMRTTQVLEVELHSPIKFERRPKFKAKEEARDEKIWGNRGYITESTTPEIAESTPAAAKMEQYTVQKGDTLQKISKKFYGTTKRWNKIFEANKDKLKASNKIYPGQIIGIPKIIDDNKKGGLASGEPLKLKETKENLK